KTHLDKPVVKVDEDDVVTAFGDFVVEGDRADPLGIGVFEPLQASGPGTRERRHSEDRAIRRASQRNGLQIRFVRETQRGAYGLLDMIGHQALLAPSLVQPVVKFGNALAKIALDLHEAAGFLYPGFGLPRVEIAAATLEKV